MESTKAKRGSKPLERAQGKGPVLQVRMAAGKTQIEFAEILGVSEATIRNYETRGVFPLDEEAQRRFFRYARENNFSYSTII